jgi:hypothetical protein
MGTEKGNEIPEWSAQSCVDTLKGLIDGETMEDDFASLLLPVKTFIEKTMGNEGPTSDTVADAILDTVECFFDTHPDFEEEDFEFGDREFGVLDKTHRRQEFAVKGVVYSVDVKRVVYNDGFSDEGDTPATEEEVNEATKELTGG